MLFVAMRRDEKTPLTVRLLRNAVAHCVSLGAPIKNC